MNEVVTELRQENAVPSLAASGAPATALTAMAGGEPLMPGGLAAHDLDVDLSRIKLSGEQAEGMSKQLASLAADQRGDQLQRLERSLLRLERINVQTLTMLQKLVSAVKTPEGGNT